VRLGYESAVYLAEVLEHVPVFVIPCLNSRVNLSSNATASGAYGSIWPAAWSFQLALHSRGLGTVFTTLHLHGDGEREVANLLGMPHEVTQAALLPVAYTIGSDFKPAPRTPVQAVTYWDQWGIER
jgi:nitroreductase